MRNNAISNNSAIEIVYINMNYDGSYILLAFIFNFTFLIKTLTR